VVRCGDINGDGKKEIIAASSNCFVYAFDRAGKLPWKSLTFAHHPTSIALARLPGGKLPVIVGNTYCSANVYAADGKPTMATIMLGMNDVGVRGYGPDKVGPQFEQARRVALNVYNENMVKLISALQKSGARLILITPSIYDDTLALANAKSAAYVGANSGLGNCAQKVREWSAQYKTGLADFYGVMCAINPREQKKDPKFSVVGPERVHPGAVANRSANTRPRRWPRA
jgi:hypothetical protein